ncbi:hypothetical protein AGLY_010450 [Aphis glycines]|uniref:Uncharacterized protein n=1 Tax=Aphis glycines TaxID=307491 RepID=A0A6G0TE70_APHGL|nr:hypothetical protein AGLY_010450 [Aphis glycines]
MTDSGSRASSVRISTVCASSNNSSNRRMCSWFRYLSPSRFSSRSIPRLPHFLNKSFWAIQCPSTSTCVSKTFFMISRIFDVSLCLALYDKLNKKFSLKNISDKLTLLMSEVQLLNDQYPETLSRYLNNMSILEVFESLTIGPRHSNKNVKTLQNILWYHHSSISVIHLYNLNDTKLQFLPNAPSPTIVFNSFSTCKRSIANNCMVCRNLIPLIYLLFNRILIFMYNVQSNNNFITVYYLKTQPSKVLITSLINILIYSILKDIKNISLLSLFFYYFVCHCECMNKCKFYTIILYFLVFKNNCINNNITKYYITNIVYWSKFNHNNHFNCKINMKIKVYTFCLIFITFDILLKPADGNTNKKT